MSQLIHIRQRIKAIETIKKITHAMRLISMSNHSRLSKRQKALNYYHTAITSLFSTLHPYMADWENAIMKPLQPASHRPLIILFGSHKGLCGTFNSGLFSYTKEFLRTKNYYNPTFFCVGTKAVDFITSHYPHAQHKAFLHCTGRTFTAIAHTITHDILYAPEPYSSVTIISNKAKSFFVQKPEATPLIPCILPPSSSVLPEQELTWDYDPHNLLDYIAIMYIESTLQQTLFESMQAEHAIRFISMDNSTRNANTMLESTKLMYNKLRQAKITKELAELSGSFNQID